MVWDFAQVVDYLKNEHRLELPPTEGSAKPPTKRVRNARQLIDAAQNAKPGDVIQIEAGVYRGKAGQSANKKNRRANANFRITKSGTEKEPITWRVSDDTTWTNCRVDIEGDYNSWSGGRYDNGYFCITGKYNELFDMQFEKGDVGYNSSRLAAAIHGVGSASYNRIHHVSIGHETEWKRRAISFRDMKGAKGNWVDHCHIKNIPDLGKTNAGEPFQNGAAHVCINYQKTGTVFCFNAFEECFGDDEGMSIKSGGILFVANFIRKTKGWVQTRTSSNNIIAANVFRSAPGIAILGHCNTVIGNDMGNGAIVAASGNATMGEVSTVRNGKRPWQGQHPASVNTYIIGNKNADIEVGKRKTGGRPGIVSVSHHKRNIQANKIFLSGNIGCEVKEHEGRFKNLKADYDYSGVMVEPHELNLDEIGNGKKDRLRTAMDEKDEVKPEDKEEKPSVPRRPPERDADRPGDKALSDQWDGFVVPTEGNKNVEVRVRIVDAK